MRATTHRPLPSARGPARSSRASETDRFRVAALGGMAAELAGDHARAAALPQEAVRRADQLEDPRALVWAALMATTGGALGDGLRWATRAVTIARERALLDVLPVALWQQAAALVGQGRFNLAYAAGEEGLRLASDFGHSWGASWNLANLATARRSSGRRVTARAHAEEAVELAATSGAP